MAEKKKWRDYTQTASTKKDTSTEKTGGWRDYVGDQSGSTSQSNGSWRSHSNFNDIVTTAGKTATELVNNWLNKHNSYLTDYQKRYEGRKNTYEDAYVSDSADWLTTAEQRKHELDNEAESFLSYLAQYERYLDAGWVNDVKNTIANARSTQGLVLKGSQSDYDYWSKFMPNEEQTAAGYTADQIYKEWQEGQKQYAEDQAYDVEAGMLELEALKKERDSWVASEKEKRQKEEKEESFWESLGKWLSTPDTTIPLADAKAWVSGESTSNEYDNKIAALEERIERAKYVQGYEGYMDNIEAKDYAANSQYVSTRTDVAKEDALWGLYKNQYDESKLFGDFLYDYINRNEDALAVAKVNNVATDAYLLGFDKGFLQTMTDDEIGVYNYIYKSQGKDSANEYLSFLQNDLQGRKKAQEQAYWANYAKEDPFGSSAFSVLISPLKGLSYLGQATDMLADGKMEQNAGYNRFSYIPTTIQSTVSNGIEKNWGKVGSFAYNTGMSMANFLFTTAVSGGNQALSLAIMGSGAAADATISAKDRGLDDGQAFTLGTIAGLAEVAMEKISLGAWLEGDMTEGALRYMLNNALSEGIEEAGTSVVNLLADVIIAGDKSEWNVAMQAYIDEGKTPEEAFGLVAAEQAAQIGLDALGGILSGGVIGGGTYAGTSIGASADYGDIAKNKESAQKLVAEGLELNPKNQYVQKMQSKLEKGKSLSGMQVRNILAANKEQITSNDMKKIQQAAEKRLTDLGQTKDVSEVAEIATKWATGQELTRAEKKLLTHSEYGSRVANELLPSNIDSEDYSTEWAEEIGTEIVNAKAYNKKAIRALLDAMASMEDTNAYKSLEDRVGDEKKLNVSKSGQATIRETGDAIDLSKARVAEFITDKKTGKITDMTLEADGKVVKSSEIDYSDDSQAYLFSAVSKIENITPADATAIIRDYDQSSGLSVGEYLNGVDEGFTYGYYGYSEADLKAGDFTTKLSESQAKNAYMLGIAAKNESKNAKTDAIKRMRTAVEAEAQKATAEGKEAPKAKKMTITYNAGGGKIVGFDKAGLKLTAKQKTAPALAQVFHEMGLGTSFEMFASYVNKDGVRVFLDENGVEQKAYSGLYRKSDGTIRIDLNAYNGRQLTLDAMSHELTHFIQQWSDEKYQALADFLIKAYEKTDMTMHDRVIREQARLKKIRGEDVSYNEAFDEVVANAMGKMLADGKVMDRLAELRAKDMDLAQKLWEGLKKFLTKFFRIAEKESALFHDAADLMELKAEFEQMQKMWADAFVEASENFQASLIAKEAGTDIMPVEEGVQYSYSSLAEAAGFTAVENDDGTRSFVRDGKKVSQVTVDDIENSPIGAFINFSLEMNDISKADADRQKKMFADICTMACKTNDFAMTMQFVGSAVFTGMKANADKQYGTTYDFPSICTKTQAVIDAMSAKMMSLGRGLNTNEIVKLYDDVFASGNPVPCPECYVFSRWIGIGGLLDNIKKYQDYYGSMDVKDVASAYLKMKAEVSKFADEQGISFGKAKGALTSKLTKEFNKLTEKIEKAQNQGEKVKPADKQRLSELEPMMNTVKSMTWLENVYFADSSLKKVNPNFRVPDSVLFDLNNGEVFATKYKDAWAFRTTQGAGYGKAITPYAEARLGEGVLVTNNTTNAIKGRAQGSLDNYFLQQMGKLDKKSKDALKRARMKQKIQAFIGGQRFQSTSDARYENASDYLLAALEMQAMGGMVQVYTKVDGAVPAFSAWGFSINQSLMPLNSGLDADGNVKDTSVGGMNPKVAFENRNKHESAGTITIGVNDNHIRAMFKQWVRDFIIPYHASGGKADVVNEFRRIQEGKDAKGEAVRSTDYSRTQSDKILSDEVLRWQGKTDAQIQRIHEIRNTRIAILTGGKPNMTVVRSNRFLSALYDKLNGGEWDGVKLAKSKVESQIYPNEFWDQTVTYDESAKITKDYLEYCDDLGFLHRFSGMIPSNGKLVPANGYNENGARVQLTDLAYKYDESGNKTAEVEEFFWKVLTDRRMYDNNGKYLPQKVVTLNDTTTDTVTGFAKHNQGREYDKAKAEALAKKIVNGEQYSSQETDIDTAGKVNYDNENVNLQEVNGNARREETREDFHRRAVQEGCTVNDGGEIAYAFRPIADWNLSESIRIAERNLRQKGIQVIVCDLFEVNRNGITTQMTNAISAAGEAVYLYTAMETDPIETAEHEAYHFWKHTQARMDYFAELYKNFDFDSPAAIDLLGKIEKAYIESQKANVEIDVEVDSDESVKIIEEAFAYVTGFAASGDQLGIAHKILRDFDAVKAAWDDLIKKQTASKSELYSSHETDNISHRDLLANAFEGITQNSIEYKLIQEYKGRIRLLNEYEEKLSTLNAEIRKMMFDPNTERNSKKLKELQDEAKKVAENINRNDKKLLSLEASEPLRKVIERERKKESQKTKDHMKEIQQNKKVRAEQTELRHKIRKTIRDLDKILNRGNKKQNVKEDMKGFVSKALELADYLFTDHISNDDLIRRGIDAELIRGEKEAQLVKETEEILTKLYDKADSLSDEEFTRLDAKRKANEDKLRDLLTSQRNKRLNTPVYNLFNDLVTEYASLKNSSQDAVKAAYNAEVERLLRTFLGDADSDRAKVLQNMRVADMTTDELWKLYNAYTMVLTTVRDANKFFAKGMTESIDNVVTQIVMDFGSRKIPDNTLAVVAQKLTNKIGWDYEKLYYALDRIGSDAFTKLIMNIADSENTVMQDIMEAVAFRDQIVEKYGFNNWDVNKKIDREFLDNTGKKFTMTLGELMSLYAYSRRKGAWDHIEYGGFVFGEKALTNPKPADSYKLSKEQCEAITSLLTNEQKAYVEDMQKFLSETMGEKGNEVSMQLYGIKMFQEKNYFPIHIAGEYQAKAQESKAKQAAGFGSMSNAGFTHEQNPNAKAPFVLEGFNEIWSDHVNEMSRYHGTVPALEDLRRVMNRSSYSESTAESTSVQVVMENHFGEEAVKYFDNLYREANSGATIEKLEKWPKKLLSLFRKNSVAYSLSVLIQQPASIVRAYAMIDKKYFGYKGFGTITSGVAKAISDKWTKAHTNAYNEMLKYAPGVTMAKEIGGFDTATGGSIRRYLLDTGKSFGQKVKTDKHGKVIGTGKAVLDFVDDNAIANLPNVADKIAWIEIWNACKRETVAKHKDLATSSEEFMQIVGDRFTEVIRATQVYDSIFAKSPMLKSKYLAVQYLVSFMNEPNTVANMAEKAVRDAIRGDWKKGAKTAAVVAYSIIFTNVLKSIIYAMRDDDEDETYIEKYAESIVGGVMDDLFALNYIPLIRDVVSIAQGYDVERADMAIVADFMDAIEKVNKFKNTETDGMTEEQLIELEKKQTEANWKLVESLAAFFGIPVKNIRREVNGVVDHFRIASANAGMTTANSVWDKVHDAVMDSLPEFLATKATKSDKLYDAIVSGDKEYLGRIKSTYKTDDAYQSAVRKALRENDSRIHDAAQARYDGNVEEYKRIFREIQNEGKFSFDDIMSAINSEESKIRNKLEPEKVTSQYSASGFVESVILGDTNTAQAMKEDIIATKVANGKTQNEAEKEFTSAVATGIHDAYSSGLLDEARAKNMLLEYTDMDKEDVDSRVGYWAFCEDNPKYANEISESKYNKYKEFAEPESISLDVFVQYINGTKDLATKYDEWGEVEVSEREQVLEVIDSLPLTWQQKDALYLAHGYAESKIWDVPW